MINYTTPTISLIVENIDISNMDVYVTLQQGCYEMTKRGADLVVTAVQNADNTVDTSIVFTLSQMESASFLFNHAASIQVNWISQQGVRGATEIKGIPVLRNLLDEVISYAN